MKLSKKKETELYNVVHEEVMQVRIKIARNHSTMISTKYVDDLLSTLCWSAPKKAIEVFTTPPAESEGRE